jgi:hypothetical protein
VFNALDIVESESATRRYKEKEIKHGRLAMVAMLGFSVQVSILCLLQCRFIRRGSCHARVLCAGQYVTPA